MHATPHSNPSNRSSQPPNTPNTPPISPSISAKATSSPRVKKRTLNTLAARRYRQKRVDQMSSLETLLKESQAERDRLRIRVARLEGEVEVLRGVVGAKV